MFFYLPLHISSWYAIWSNITLMHIVITYIYANALCGFTKLVFCNLHVNAAQGRCSRKDAWIGVKARTQHGSTNISFCNSQILAYINTATDSSSGMRHKTLQNNFQQAFQCYLPFNNLSRTGCELYKTADHTCLSIKFNFAQLWLRTLSTSTPLLPSSASFSRLHCRRIIQISLPWDFDIFLFLQGATYAIQCFASRTTRHIQSHLFLKRFFFA